MCQSSEPEMNELSEFLYEFNKESDRGATLNAPLGTFASKATAAHPLGLIQDNEFREIKLIRKIRNEFGHSWKGVNFESEKVLKLANQLPWCGPAELEETSNSRTRFNAAIAILLTDLMWRSRLIKKEKLKTKVYPNKMWN